MTDNEIVKALKLCITQDGSIPCYDCPCWCDDKQKCVGLNYAEILDLINRQKAEIERLEIENMLTLNELIEALEKQIPKKPIEQGEGISFNCPVCGNYVGYVAAMARETQNYCNECGQALEWSEQNG